MNLRVTGLVCLIAVVCCGKTLAVNGPAVTGQRSLTGHVPAAARQVQPVGRLAASSRLRLALGLPLRNQSALTNLLKELYDPASPQYRQFLTPDRFTAMFGPTEAEYQAVIDFALTNGLRVTTTHPNRLLLDVEGSVGDIERAFHTVLRTYPHPRQDRDFFAPENEPAIEPRVPILHVTGLDNFIIPHPASLHAMPLDSGGSNPKPLGGSGPGGSYRGKDYRGAYARNVTLTGAGQMVGLLQFDGYYPSDIASYASQAGIPAVPLIDVFLDDFTGPPGKNNSEVAMDIELVMAMAPGLSNIIVYQAAPGGFGNDILNRMATDNLAKQLSASWSFGTDTMTTQIFQQLAAQGQSYFNASGDNGAYSGVVDPPSDEPYITVVGGTTLSTTGAGGAWVSETTWSWSNTGQGSASTGGGFSTQFPIPVWQQGVSMVANQGSTTMRNIPDVSMVADNVYVVYGNGSNGTFGGTSASSPLWAAFTALVNEQAASMGAPPVGFLNPLAYSIGKGAGFKTVFHDITSGNNTNSSSPNLFYAVDGYDLCTGWGSPIGQAMVDALAPRPAFAVVTNASTTLVSEGAVPHNNAIDPGETVTINFSLKNVGAVRTTNLVVTLLESDGVVAPSGPQTFGALIGGGTAVTRSFSFTARGSCGGPLATVLQLQDGPVSLGNLTNIFVLGTPAVAFSENFDSVTVPSLPSGWTFARSGSAATWSTTTTAFDSPGKAAFISEPAQPGIAELISPPVAIHSAAARLTFRNYYNVETDAATNTLAYDGGVLELKIGSGGYVDILAAGGSFASGGYSRTLDTSSTGDNPLKGRGVWSGLSGGFITTVVNLPPGAAGQTVTFKWRFATDTGNYYGGIGWYIDTVKVLEDNICADASTDLAIYQSAAPEPAIPGQDLTYFITVTNLGSQTAFNVAITDMLPANATLVSAPSGYYFTNSAIGFNLGQLAQGAGMTLPVVISPSSGAPLTNSVSVAAVTTDVNAGNNSTDLVTEIASGGPPVILEQPSNVVASVGASVTFQVLASGMPAPTYQWLFNGSTLVGAVSSALNLDNVQQADMGDYQVIVDNPSGSVTSSVAHLTLLIPPELQLPVLSSAENSVSLSFTSVMGLSYLLEFKTNLEDNAWVPLPPALPGTGGTLTVVDTNGTTFPSRYYRLHSQ